MDILDTVLYRYFDKSKIDSPLYYNNQRVLTTSEVMYYFGFTPSKYTAPTKMNYDYFEISEAELRKFILDNRIECSGIRIATLWTIPGIIRNIAYVKHNAAGTDLVIEAFKACISRFNDYKRLAFTFDTFYQIYDADKKVFESRLTQLEESSKALSIDTSAIPEVSSRSTWTDPNGYIHVPVVNRHVSGYYSMLEVAYELKLFSKTMNPHVQLAEDICRTALGVSKGSEQPQGENWQTFKYSYSDCGVRVEGSQFRITEAGMRLVADWWLQNASKHAINRGRDHGYAFSKNWYVYDNISSVKTENNNKN